MKKIIDGKLYNTNTATLICEVPNHHYRGDFAYEDTRLYRSPRGTYFLAGSGGPMSRWARPEGMGSWTAGTGLCIVSADVARQIAENACLDENELSAAGFVITEG